MSEQRAKPLHEYPRGFTEQQIEEASRHIADGMTITEMAKLMGLTRNRAATLRKNTEAQRIALRIRDTEIIPTAFGEICRLVENMSALVIGMEDRLKRHETLIGAMSKSLGMAKIRDRRQREKISELRATEKRLRQLIRGSGLLAD